MRRKVLVVVAIVVVVVAVVAVVVGVVVVVVVVLKSLAATTFLLDNGRMHIAEEWILNVLRPGLEFALQREAASYYRRNPSELTLDDVDAYIELAKTDVTFMQSLMFLREIIPAFSLMLKGVRNCNWFAMNAGRAYLLPFQFGLKLNSTYGRDIIDDMANFFYTFPRGVALELRKIFAFRGDNFDGNNNEQVGEGYDGKLEEWNRKMSSSTIMAVKRVFKPPP